MIFSGTFRTFAFAFAFTAFVPTAHAGMVTLYIIPSPLGLNWDSPKTLVLSAVRNYLTHARLPFGHVNLHLKCSVSWGDPIDFEDVTGSLGTADDPSKSLLFNQGYGLGILFATMPGRLEPQAEALREVRARIQNGNVRFLQFKTDGQACRKMADHLNNFRAQGYDRLYGLANRPLMGEGGVCTTFAESFLEVAGIYTPQIRSAWERIYLVPERLIGGPLTGNFVPARILLLPLRPFWRHRWASSNEPHFSIRILDPESMIYFIDQSWANGSSFTGETSMPAIPATMGQARGLIIDATSR